MKSLLALAIFFSLSVGNIQAQQAINPTLSQSENSLSMEMLTEKLNLTAEQQANISKTFTAFQDRIDGLQSSELNNAEKTKRVAAYKSRMDANFKTYLTEDQYTTYQKLKGLKKEY